MKRTYIIAPTYTAAVRVGLLNGLRSGAFTYVESAKDLKGSRPSDRFIVTAGVNILSGYHGIEDALSAHRFSDQLFELESA